MYEILRVLNEKSEGDRLLNQLV